MKRMEINMTINQWDSQTNDNYNGAEEDWFCEQLQAENENTSGHDM